MVEKGTEIYIGNELEKPEAVDLVDKWRFDLGLSVEEIDVERPWGAFWKIKRSQTGYFLNLFFPEIKELLEDTGQNLSPKFLLVAPHSRLSWQFHNRRAEEWVVVCGQVGVVTSDDDTEKEEVMMGEGRRISLGRGTRHRLTGKDNWGLVAEIWVHSDPSNPSDEEDVVRLQDDYARA